jgi:hypothetical protein
VPFAAQGFLALITSLNFLLFSARNLLRWPRLFPAPRTRAHSFFGFCVICFGTADFPALFSSSRVSGAQSCWSVFSSRAGCLVTFPVGLGAVRLRARESIEVASLVSCQGLIFFDVVFGSACCECAGQESCARLGATGIPL